MWDHLKALKASSSLPWVVLGDFNEALWQYEHFSARQRPEPQMAAFRDCLQICELKDIGFSVLSYTLMTISRLAIIMSGSVLIALWLMMSGVISIQLPRCTWSHHVLIMPQSFFLCKRRFVKDQPGGLCSMKFSGRLIRH
jgi:hypothetical protein